MSRKPIDWEQIGFRGGIEIHQQLDTSKLFCECPATLRNDPPPFSTMRRLHAVASEMGEYDPAALHEARRARTFHYQSYPDSVCLVELDEEPPHPVNREAIEIVLQAALLLDARVVDEIQVMRKTVIDGSNTAGFQRTMLVGTDGVMNTRQGPVTLQYFCLEEDAARIISATEREVVYRLDRLGIPLLEIVTGPVFRSPDQGGEVADRLGHLARSLKVRRGIGSIRQDVNVSTRFGTRIEIKGVPRHRMVPRIMAWEAERQTSLWEMAQLLQKRRAPITAEELAAGTLDVTDLLAGTAAAPLRRVLDRGGRVIAIAASGFEGLLGHTLCPGKRFGTELKEQVLTLGIRGLMHSDEDLASVGLTAREISQLRGELNAGRQGAFLLFASPPAPIENAIDKLHDRLRAAFEGVPKESRRALADGNSQYMRPLPGEARMYPETDIPPVHMHPDYVARVQAELPETLDARLKRLGTRCGRTLDELRHLEEWADALEWGLERAGLDPATVWHTLAAIAVDVRRRTGVTLENKPLRRVFDALADGHLLREAVPPVLERLAAGEPVEKALQAHAPIEEDPALHVDRILAEHPEFLPHPKREAIYMGLLMENLRGRIEGRQIIDTLTLTLKKHPVEAR